MNLTTSALFVGLLCTSPAFATDVLEQGFEATPQVLPGGSSTRTLSSGDIITVDSVGVDRWKADGTFVQNLGVFPTSIFGGCFDVDPTESFAIVGRTDSSATPNPVYRVALDGSGMTQIADIVFNYDGAFTASGDYYLSAAIGGFGAGNSLLRVDTTTGAVTELGQLPGASGPIGVDALGNLYYATISSMFPAPAGSTDVVLFTAADLATADCNLGTCLGLGDAIPFATGYDGASSLVVDKRTGHAYMVENNFGTGANRIWAITGGPSSGTPLVEGQTFNWMSNLEVQSGVAAPELRAYQPADDARLFYTTTDFVNPAVRSQVQAKRSELQLSGAGLLGAGTVDITVTGAEPGGGALLFFGPTALVSGTEGAFSLAGVVPTLFTGLDLASVQVFGGVLPVDGAGSASTSFLNPGGYAGLVTLQALVLDTNLVDILGTSTSSPF